jgi:replicative DNA helicase
MLEAEQFMLSAVWVSNDAEMIRKLEKADFVDPVHQFLLNVLQEVLSEGVPLSIIAVMRKVNLPDAGKDLPEADRDSLASHVVAILDSPAFTAHIPYYYQVLREDRVKRGILKLLDHVQARLHAGTTPEVLLSLLMEQGEVLRDMIPAKRKDSLCPPSTETIPRSPAEPTASR